MGLQNITPEPGYLVFHYENGTSTRYAISAFLRALDIPVGLNHVWMKEITTLANLVADLTKKLIAAGVLDAEFTGEDGYDLEAIIQTIEAMGGSYSEPDLNTE
jgi:hypothetical protein